MSALNLRFAAGALLLLPPLALMTWLALWPDFGWYDGVLTWVFEQQRYFYDTMKASLSSIADKTGVGGALTLVAGAFLYGVFHAAGPGHGKVILSTYLLAQPETLPRSIMLAFASALLQGLVAITLVYGLFYVFDMVPQDSRAAVLWSERLSYLLVIAIGGWLAWRGVRALKASVVTTPSAHNHHDNSHSHSHDHGHGHGHEHKHDHAEDGVCSTCGHAHFPSVEQSATVTDWRSFLGVIFSIGLRPCSGAVLVLVFARFAGIPWAGMLAVLAMSIGTAITVSALALTAVYLRDAAANLASSSGKSLTLLGGITMAGAGFIFIAFGYGLLIASYSPAVRSMGL